jgi:hypothetical protein
MMSNGSDTGNGSPTGAFDSVQAFDSLFFPEEDKKTTTGEANPDPETDEELEEGAEANEDESSEAESDESEDQDEAKSNDDTYTVRVDGEEVKVKLDELLNGYSRTSDYTRKTQALANERKSFEQELNQVRAERAEYGQYLNQLRGLVTNQMGPEPNWEALRQQDPVNFAVARQEWSLKQEQLARVTQEQQRVATMMQQEAEQKKAAHLAGQRQMLPKIVPEWSDPSTAAADREKIVKAMTSVGYRPEELQIYDARAMALLRKAALYDEIMAGKPVMEKKVQAAKVAQPGRPSKPKSDARRALDRLSQSGRITDAAALFESIL